MPRFALIGSGIAHSGSPALFQTLCGGRYSYDLVDCTTFEQAWSRFISDYDGVNVTAPFKTFAAAKADNPSQAVQRTRAANILRKHPDGIAAYNSDYLAVKALLQGRSGTAVVIGTGGAGRSAAAAAADLGFEVSCLHHNEIAAGASADVIIYTLPCAVPGIEALHCGTLLEANYKDPCLSAHEGYISGHEWLEQQARLGYKYLTGND